MQIALSGIKILNTVSRKVFSCSYCKRMVSLFCFVLQCSGKHIPANTYYFKSRMETVEKDVIDVVLVFLLTLNILHTFFYCFFCWIGLSKCFLRYINRARSLVVSDLRSETKGSRFEFGCQLCVEVSSLQ